ncbi:ead/Ea22-like family protein [Klebsiella pneumoniae]
MTDITELAQREKFEAWVMTQICISKSTLEGLRTSDGYRNSTLSGRDYNLMWNLWKAAGAELVEALEYYKSREERVTSLVRDNSKSWDELYRQVEAKGKRNVELVEALESEKRICATWRKTAEANSEKLEKAQQQMTESENRVRKQNRHICELFDDNTALRQRIAELESRTVKMPHRNLGHSKLFLLCPFPYYDAEDMEKALAAEGIKWEAE